MPLGVSNFIIILISYIIPIRLKRQNPGFINAPREAPVLLFSYGQSSLSRMLLL